jgi:hypothetical protein
VKKEAAEILCMIYVPFELLRWRMEAGRRVTQPGSQRESFDLRTNKPAEASLEAQATPSQLTTNSVRLQFNVSSIQPLVFPSFRHVLADFADSQCNLQLNHSCRALRVYPFSRVSVRNFQLFLFYHQGQPILQSMCSIRFFPRTCA